MSNLAKPAVKEIPLWPGLPPGTEDWSHREREFYSPPPLDFWQVRNVVTPTIVPYLPTTVQQPGAAVIICPGGAFHTLAITHEGYEVAEWFLQRGVAAFVLKYRVAKTSEDDAEVSQAIDALIVDRPRLRAVTEPLIRLAVADARQALKLVRSRAAEWQLDPGRVGIMGFSAGARVALGVALENEAASRPAFAAPIYGALWDEITPPEAAPPLFVAFAGDDWLAVDPGLRLYSAWQAANLPAELHIFSKGGHGFGMKKQGLPADHWIDLLENWLLSQGFM